MKWIKQNIVTATILVLTIGLAIFGNWKDWKAIDILICVFTGALTAYTWQQNRIFERQLKLDLYDKRFAVYEALAITIPGMAITYSAADNEKVLKMKSILQSASFLFKPEVISYFNSRYDPKMTELARNLIASDACAEKYKDVPRFDGKEPSMPEMIQLDNERMAIARWFTNETQTLKALMEPYLDFREI